MNCLWTAYTGKTIMTLLGLMVFLVLILAGISGCEGKESHDHFMARGDQAMSQGRFQDATTAYQNYLEQYPEGKNRWKAWQRLVTLNRDIFKDRDTAGTLLASMYLEFGEDPLRAVSILLQQASLQQEQGDTETALSTLEKGLSLPRLAPQQQWELLFALGKTAFQAQRFDRAHQYLAQTLALAPDQPAYLETAHLAGLCLVCMKAYDHAEQLLANVYAQAPAGVWRARIGMTRMDIAQHQGRLHDALLLLQEIKPHYPNPRALEIRERALKAKIPPTS
jgi:tetratricopeptide (TPR) repeat protein